MFFLYVTTLILMIENIMSIILIYSVTDFDSVVVCSSNWGLIDYNSAPVLWKVVYRDN